MKRKVIIFTLIAIAGALGLIGFQILKNVTDSWRIDGGGPSRERYVTQWRAQGWGFGRHLVDTAGNILVLYDDAEYLQPQIEAFQQGLIAAGIPEQRTKFRVLQVGSNPKLPESMTTIPGMSLEMLMASEDFQTVLSAYKPEIAISLLGLPRDAMVSQYDFTRGGATVFLVGGNTYHNENHLKMMQAGRVSGVLRLKSDCPGVDDEYSREPELCFAEFYELATPNNAERLLPEPLSAIAP